MRRRAALAALSGFVVLATVLSACSTGPAPRSTGTPTGGADATAASSSTPTPPSSSSTSSPVQTPTRSSASPTPAPPTSASCARDLVDGLSGPERAGQLLMVALDANAGRASLDGLIADGRVGGVVFLGGWYDGADAVRQATRHLESAAESGDRPGLLLAADQEGGQVQQLRGDGFTRMPTALAQGRLSPNELTERASGWAGELHDAGINVNLAPVADTVPASIGRANAPIGQYDRQFSSDPATVSRMVGAFIEGMHRGDVAATIKHFPGIGRITGNTDVTSEGIVDRTTTATDPYLRPFATGIADGADLVMVGSAIYTRIDPGVQAIFSKRIVTDLLRDRMGYQGVVITDDVGAAKSVSGTPVGERATKFVDAGGDIVLTARPDTVPTMHQALTRRMAADPDFASKVAAAATRVMTLKVDLGLAHC